MVIECCLENHIGEVCSSPRNKLMPFCEKTCENSCHSTRHMAKMPCCILKKLKSGNRDIFKSYISHCRYKGKFHKQLHQRRLTEFAALYNN